MKSLIDVITAENNALVLPQGTILALVNGNGEIVKQGSTLEIEVFDAMKEQVVLQVFSSAKPLDSKDFN